MRLQFSITICLSFVTAGKCSVVTKVNSLCRYLFLLFKRADCLESKVTSDRNLSNR